MSHIESSLVLPVYKDEKVLYLMVFVILSKNTEISSRELNAKAKSDLKSLIPSYMIPRKIKAIDSFPLNTSGKIDRKKLLEEYR